MDRMRAFWSFFDVKGNMVAFVKRPESRCLNAGMMDEHIRTVFLLDKTITLAVIKPLHNTICHSDTPFVSVIAIVPYCRMPPRRMDLSFRMKPALN
jgi:hypothetical protein